MTSYRKYDAMSPRKERLRRGNPWGRPREFPSIPLFCDCGGDLSSSDLSLVLSLFAYIKVSCASERVQRIRGIKATTKVELCEDALKGGRGFILLASSPFLSLSSSYRPQSDSYYWKFHLPQVKKKDMGPRQNLTDGGYNVSNHILYTKIGSLRPTDVEALTCGICSKILREPMQLITCGCRFCNVCIQKIVLR